MTTDQVAKEAGISRALLYRYEAGDVVKLEVLERLAQLYQTSTSALLGVGNDYITQGLPFFERIQRLEEHATHITIVFGPQAYLLSSDAYDRALMRRLTEQRADNVGLNEAEATRLGLVLKKRKETFLRKRGSLLNIIPVGDLERYLALGLGGHQHMPALELAARRREARYEIELLAERVASPPMGVQIGLTNSQLPNAGFELIQIADRNLLVVSPFRIVEPVNMHYGVAMFSEEEEPLRLHRTLVDRLWDSALRGAAATEMLARLLREAPVTETT